MQKNKCIYKKVDKFIYGELKEILLIGEGEIQDSETYYYVFWKNNVNQDYGSHVTHTQLFDWFKISQAEFDKKYVKYKDLDG